MSVSQIAQQLVVKTFNTGEIIQMGSAQLANNLELLYVRAYFFMKGVSSRGGSERIRIIIYGDSGYTSALYTSAWADVTLANISNLADSVAWIGWIRTTFTRQNLNKNIIYYIGCEIGNYTRNADTFYCGLFYDFPYQIYGSTNTVFYTHNLGFQFFGYQDRA